MIVIRETVSATRRPIVASLATFAEAVAYARATFKVAFLDEDEDYPDCADFITHGGTVYAIEPEGFKL